MNLLNSIEAIFSTLSRQERKVALKVLQNPQEVQSMNITKLAKKAGVSNATITRFVRRMECSDFHDFKLKLAVSAASSPEVPVSSENNSMGDKVYEFYQKVLQGTWKQLDTDTIHNIVRAITKARRVYVYGLGSSGYTAQEFTQRLIRMGIAAFCTVDSHMMFIDSTIVNSDDVIIAISQSGNTDDVNVACSLAKQKGTKIISITGFYQSPLIELSTWSVVVKNSNFVDNTRFINSQLAIVYVIDIITMELMEKSEYSSTMNKTVELIMDRKLSKQQHQLGFLSWCFLKEGIAMKITVVGGTGLIGQGILSELSKDKSLDLHSISRNGKRPNSIAGVNYHSFDLAHDTSWHSLLQTSDWVIDCVGILLPNKSKNQTYENSSIEPAKLIIDNIANFDNKFLFISANSAPFFLNNYLHAKRTVENYASRKLGNRAISVYPGLVYSKFRRSNYYLAVMLDFLLKFKLFSFLRKYRPISRERFAKEIHYIIEGKNSSLTYRI